MCQEFHCLPSEACAELLDDPDNLAMTVMELREYQRAYQAVQQAREHSHAEEPSGPMVELVHEINYQLLKEDRGGG